MATDYTPCSDPDCPLYAEGPEPWCPDHVLGELSRVRVQDVIDKLWLVDKVIFNDIIETIPFGPVGIAALGTYRHRLLAHR